MVIEFLQLQQEEVGQHRAKVARARDGIEKIKQEKEVLIIQVQEVLFPVLLKIFLVHTSIPVRSVCTAYF